MSPKILFFLSLFVSFQCLSAQKLSSKSYIQVIGVERYIEMAEARVIELTFVEDPNRCDPVRGNLTLTEQFSYFSKELAKSNIIFSSFEEMEQSPQMKLKHKNFKYKAKRFEDINRIQEAAALQNIQVKQIYYAMPEHRFEHEDERAIMALRDAVRRARTIAAKMGNKKVKIVGIDDDTSQIENDDLLDMMNFYQPNHSEEEIEQTKELLSLLMATDIRTDKSFDNFKKGGYSLLVTFQVE